MLVTRSYHEAAVEQMRRDEARFRAEATARHARDVAVLQAERDAARGDLLVWRSTAVEALRSIAELQRRYAPPAPIEGEVEQPPSVGAADQQAVAAARNPEGGEG